MSDPATPSKFAGLTAIIIAVINLALTAGVNFQVKRAESRLQLEIKQAEANLEQAKSVSAVANKYYLDQIPKLHDATEQFLVFGASVAEGKVTKVERKKADEMRINVRMLAASCETRPDDPQLKKASAAFDTAVDELAESIIDGEIDEQYHERMKTMLTTWKEFQAEAYRVALGGYARVPQRKG